MGLGHAHGGHGTASSAARGAAPALATVLALTTAYTLAEALGGLLTGSLALLADAGHMLLPTRTAAIRPLRSASASSAVTAG